MDRINFTISEDQAGVRVDKFLSNKIPDLSRSYIQKLADSGNLTINDKKPKISYKLKANDYIKLEIPEPIEVEITAENIPLDIILEDEHLIIINKSAGMVVHPDNTGNTSGTLVNALLYHCPDSLSGIGGVKRPGIVHRLDKDTSGLIIVAKNDKAHQELSKMFQERTIEKTYLALTKGVISNTHGTINAPIGRDPRERKKMTVIESTGSKNAITHFNLKQAFSNYSFLEVKIETGRTHQIRVHLKSIGHPIVGDQVYGDPSINKNFRLKRQFLHAHKLKFTHPITKKEVEIKSPLPLDLKQVLNSL